MSISCIRVFIRIANGQQSIQIQAHICTSIIYTLVFSSSCVNNEEQEKKQAAADAARKAEASSIFSINVYALAGPGIWFGGNQWVTVRKALSGVFRGQQPTPRHRGGILYGKAPAPF